MPRPLSLLLPPSLVRVKVPCLSGESTDYLEEDVKTESDRC